MAELNVSRKNVSTLLSEMRGKKFIIPDYQRPYKWDEEKCEILWEDITNFHVEKNDSDEYFLGTIVSYKNENDKNQIEIIDGQQRLTSFFLLFRAFYKKLEEMPEDDNVKGLKNQIAPCIWDIDPISQKVSDKKKFHIESLVATDDDKSVFHSILETGVIDSNKKDLYTINYSYFYKKCNEYAQHNPLQWQPLCVSILHKCIVLPIECDVEDTALTIFSTLNDRGLPLSDSDIFKAQIYKSKKTDDEKRHFTDNWKNLTSICKTANISLDDIFRYYTHCIRANNEDKSKEIGLRKFYANNKYAFLCEEELIPNLLDLAKFWQLVNSGKNDTEFSFNFEINKYFQCLSHYPNEYWKYFITVYYFFNKNSQNFIEDFEIFLRKLTAYMIIKFIERPTVNAIKDDIFVKMVDIKKDKLEMKFDFTNTTFLRNKISEFSSSKISRTLILLHAYLNENQTELISKTFDIEHIFPKKWQNTNYNGWNEQEAKLHLEMFGNKIAFEKKLNIQAGNNYFGNKKDKYKVSKISVAIELANLTQTDWSKEDIEKRQGYFENRIFKFFEDNLR